MAAKQVRAWLVLIAVTVAIGVLPYLVEIAPPEGTIAVADAMFHLSEDDTEHPISLPHNWNTEGLDDLATGTYRLVVELTEVPAEALFVFIPAARHTISAWVNGQPTISALDTGWLPPSSGYSFLARIPDGAMRKGSNEIVLHQTRETGWLPARLSKLSIGTADTVMPAYRLSYFLVEQVRAMTFALHIMLTIGIATIWTARRHDPVFRWLAAISITSLLVIFTQSPLVPFGAREQFQSTTAMSAVGLMALGMALAIAGRQRPPLLLPAVILVPTVLFFVGEANLLPYPVLGLASAIIGLTAYVASAGLLAHQFAHSANLDAAILAVPCALTAWFGLHDILVVTGLYDDPFLFMAYTRTLMLLAIMVILMGRLARSLNELDNANDTLRQRLAEQEAELGLLHAKERAHAGQMVREHERQRLMQDLHDGVSGHLVTIIALAERDGPGGENIERTARAALDDLRLVVHSLDLGDGGLRVALSAFRERLEPQLRRLGIELHWSTEKLPEVSGVTPRNALSVLRILQEAVTNAIKHGTARRITVEGRATEENEVVLAVFNDVACNQTVGTGNGLGNMQRRAHDLGGHVSFVATDEYASLSVVLPVRRLADHR